MRPQEVAKAWQEGQRVDGRAANERYLADDVRLLLPGRDPIVGKDAASAPFEAVEHSFRPLRESTVEGPYTIWISEGDLVAHRFRWCGETHDGQLVDFFLFNLYRVRDDKIDHFEEHFDTLARSRYRYGETATQAADEPAPLTPMDPSTRILT